MPLGMFVSAARLGYTIVTKTNSEKTRLERLSVNYRNVSIAFEPILLASKNPVGRSGGVTKHAHTANHSVGFTDWNVDWS